MKPDQTNPLLQALFDDDAWRASFLATQQQAGRRLRVRRCWRKLRTGAAAAILVAGLICFLHREGPAPARDERAAAHAPVAGEGCLQLALNPPLSAGETLSVRAYDPLPEWTFHCEPLADSSRPSPVILSGFNTHEN